MTVGPTVGAANGSQPFRAGSIRESSPAGSRRWPRSLGEKMNSDYLRRLDVQGHLKVMEALRKWDPIGVFKIDPAWPADEYDGYSGPLVTMLDAHTPKQKMVNYLERICVEHICVSFDRDHTEKILDELIEFWPRWKKDLRERGSQTLIG